VRIPDLNLKFVAHVGPVVRQKVFGMEELVGADVIVVHRLLKNTVVESTGIEAYALFTDACVTQMGVDAEALGLRRHHEAYDVIGEVDVWVEDLEQRWLEEDARARVYVEPGNALLATSYEVAAPPPVVWEYMTTPGRRLEWSVGVTDVIQDAPGNRRGVGATNHCMHGKDAIIEEVLDWRPFDYWTLRSTMQTPGGPVKLLSTTELTPTATGTRVDYRFGKPRSAKDLALIEQLRPMFEGMVAASSAALRALLPEEVEARVAGAAPEPDVPAPRPDGLFSDMEPLQLVG
jgi:uncharacterized protein YndB with AHSA1/START domain